MKRLIDFVKTILVAFGFYPVKFLRSVKGIVPFVKDYIEFRKQARKEVAFPYGRFYPVLDDRYAEGGEMSGHYFHQDILVARRIYTNKPIHHVDIGSRVDGFVAHVAVFREIELLDIRVIHSKVNNIVFQQLDLMQLPANMIEYCDSISALHSFEHFGLGRYGDPIDYYGHQKAIQNVHKMLKTGGIFYFSVPIGVQRVDFNAQRVFSISYLLEIFKEIFSVESLSYVDDKGDLHEQVPLMSQDVENNFGCEYGCGIFELRKI